MSRSVWFKFALAMVWLFAIVWPLTGIRPEGITFVPALKLVSGIGAVALLGVLAWQAKGLRKGVSHGAEALQASFGKAAAKVPMGIWLALLGAFCMAFPFLFQARYHQDVAISVLVYTCLGLGLNIVVGLCGLLDLGFIAFYGVGAYTYALLNIHYGLTLWMCFPLAACTAAVAGCIVGYPTLRMRGDYLAIVTLGFGEIIRLVLENWSSFSHGPSGISNIGRPGLFGMDMNIAEITTYIYYLMLVLVLLTILFVNRLKNSRIGRAWLALREDEIACQAMGIDKIRTKLMAFGLGATWAGFAGVVFAAKTTFINPNSFTFLESAIILAIVVVGGMGSIWGVILGAAVLILLPEYLRAFAEYRMLIFGATMVLVMVFRPQGLISSERRKYTVKAAEADRLAAGEGA